MGSRTDRGRSTSCSIFVNEFDVVVAVVDGNGGSGSICELDASGSQLHCGKLDMMKWCHVSVG